MIHDTNFINLLTKYAESMRFFEEFCDTEADNEEVIPHNAPLSLLNLYSKKLFSGTEGQRCL
jgi:hypothetical protein